MQLTVTLTDETGSPLGLLGTTYDLNGGGAMLLSNATFTESVTDNTQVTLKIEKPGYNTYYNVFSVYDEDLDITLKIVPIVNDPNNPNYKRPYPALFFVYEPCTYNVHVYNASSTPEGFWSYYLNNVYGDSGKNVVINLYAAKTAQIKQRIYVVDGQTQQVLWDRQYATIDTGNNVIGVVADINTYLALDPVTDTNVETIEYKPELTLSAYQESGCSDDEACYNTLSELVVTPGFVLNTEIPEKIIFSSLGFSILSGNSIIWVLSVLAGKTYEIEVDVSVDTTDLLLDILDLANVPIIPQTTLVAGVNTVNIPTGINTAFKIRINNSDGVNIGDIASIKLKKPAYYKCQESSIEYSWYNFEGDLVQGPVIELIDNENPPNPDTLQTKYTPPDSVGDYKLVATLTNCCTSCTKELVIPICSFYKITETGCNEITIQNCSIDKNLSIVTIVDATTEQQVAVGEPYPIVLVPGSSKKITLPADGVYKATLQYGNPVVTKYVSFTLYCDLKACLSDYLTDILCDECDCECGGVNLEKAYFLNKLAVSAYAYFMGLNNEYNFNNIYNALNGSPPDGNFNDAVKDLLDLDFVKTKMDKYCKQKDCGKKNPCGCN